MASFSSSLPRTWRYDVFTSFHGPDVRKTFLSHLRKQFILNGISIFDDQGIEKSQTIAPALTQAIRESRISIVVLSKNYASSSWCLDELVEILNCKEDKGQIVMTVFYGVDPSHVRKQTGDFGIAFNETCARKPEERRLVWSKALNDVGNIAGEHFLNWDDESEMMAKIVRDISDKLIPSSNIITTGDKKKLRRKRKHGVNFPSSEAAPPINEPSISGVNFPSSEAALPISEPSISGVNFPYSEGALPINEPSISTKSRCSIGRAFLVVIINLLLEIAAAVADQLSSFRKPYFARISLVMSILSFILTIHDFISKIRDQNVYFQCTLPIPWFYYPSRGPSRIFGSSTDTILLFCVVGQLIVSTINYSFTERGRDGPIKISVWPLVFAIGMVVSKFMEKPQQFEEIV